MKKIITAAAAAAIAVCALSAQAFAEESARVYVTVSNGKLEKAQEAVSVHDNDGDGVLTINDALIAACGDDFASENTEFGLSMTKLCGVENGGAYGYYLNNASALSLLDPVKEGDHVSAFVYTDTTGFSDTYCFFDKNELIIKDRNSVGLTLKCASYDENWAPTELPVANARITMNGLMTDYVTDENGHVTLEPGREGQTVGEFTVSAVSDEQTLVPPVCRLIVDIPGETGQFAVYEEDKGSPDTGAESVAVFAGLALLAAGAAAASGMKRK